MITVEGLTREFQVTERDAGFRAAMRSVVKRRYKSVTAVDDVSFTVASGGVVGKTTTLNAWPVY